MNVHTNSLLSTPFYTDHFEISVTINKGTSSFVQMVSTVPDNLLNIQSERTNDNQV